jgi:hypothetical protein
MFTWRYEQLLSGQPAEIAEFKDLYELERGNAQDFVKCVLMYSGNASKALDNFDFCKVREWLKVIADIAEKTNKELTVQINCVENSRSDSK